VDIHELCFKKWNVHIVEETPINKNYILFETNSMCHLSPSRRL